MLPSEAIWGAVRIIQKHGWVQNQSGNSVIGFCALEALEQATFKNEEKEVPIKVFIEAHKSLREYVGDKVHSWNDTWMISKNQILDSMKRVADKLSSKGK